MTDLAPLAERIAARALEVPGVVVLYPTAPMPFRLLRPGAPGFRPLVRLHESGGVLAALLSVGVADDASAPAVGQAVRAVVAEELAAAGVAAHTITVRVATLG